MSAELIIWPMIIVALATLWIYLPMGKARVATVKSGKTKASVYKLNVDEPEESLRFTNALRNQYETPTLFYAVCLAAYVTGNANMVMITLAFAYAILKTVHIIIHIMTNNIRYRRPVFALSWLVLIAMWLALAVKLAGII
jgi:hypothetical protein